MENLIHQLRVQSNLLSGLALVMIGALVALAIQIYLALGYGFVHVNLVLVAVVLAVLFDRHVRHVAATIQALRSLPDERRVPAVPQQPLLEQAITPGTRLTLEYTILPSYVGKALLRIIIAGVLFAAIIEFLLASCDPDIVPLWHILGNAVLGLPLWEQWAVFALPLAWCAWIWTRVVRTRLSSSWCSVTVDDTGITIRRRFGHERHLTWSAIHGFVRISVLHGDQYLGPFAVYGPHDYAEVALLPPATWPGLHGLQSVRLSLPLSEYRAQAEQMAATICARSQVTLRGVTNTYYQRINSKHVNTFALTAQDVNAMPIPPAWQPSEEVLNQARTFPGTSTLRAEANLLQAGSLRRSRGVVRALWTPPALSLGVFLLWTSVGSDTAATIDLKLLGSIALMILLFRVITMPAIRQRRIQISADALGLHRRGLGRIDIPWANIQAFGMIPPTGKRSFATYVVLWAGPTLSWSVPLYPEPATQDAASWLNAIITARTGLPLHQIIQG
jgi:hypothetical protein